VGSLEKKLSKAYEKVGKKIGYDFDIYNPQAYDVEPIQTMNWFTRVPIGLTQSDYEDSAGEGFTLYDCYAGFSDVKAGSLLVDKPNDRIFVVTNHERNHGTNAMECFNTITISRPVNNYDGTAQTTTITVLNLPASVMITSGDVTGGLIGQSRGGTAFTHSANIRFQTVAPVDVKQGDEIVDDNNNTYEVMAVEIVATGYKVRANGIRA